MLLILMSMARPVASAMKNSKYMSSSSSEIPDLTSSEPSEQSGLPAGGEHRARVCRCGSRVSTTDGFYSVRIWQKCALTEGMNTRPYHGGTFVSPPISSRPFFGWEVGHTMLRVPPRTPTRVGNQPPGQSE